MARENYIFSTSGPSISIAPTLTASQGIFTIDPELPEGLELDRKTGIISGIPTETKSETTFTLTAKNLLGEVSSEFTMEIIDGFYVNSSLDSSDLTSNGVCLTAEGVCTLRAALEESNALAGIQNILIGENTTIVLGSSLQASASVKIIGQDQDSVVVSGNDSVRILRFTTTSHSSTLRNLTLSHGVIANERGGAVFSEGGSLTIKSVKFLNNSCTGDCGTFGGGALAMADSNNTLSVTLTIEKSYFESNLAIGASAAGGGAVWFDGSNYSVEDTGFFSNSTNQGVGIGGGFLAFEATGSFVRNFFKDNYGGFGGAIALWGGNHTIENVSFFSNESNSGSALAIGSMGIVTAANLTFLDQTAALNGGAILVANNGGNSVLNISNSIFSGNVSGITPNDCWVLGTLNSQGGNISSADSSTSNCGFASGTGDLLATNSLVQTPADNGGYVTTAAILETSPARNAGVAQYCPEEDARAFPRAAGQCDVGAFEYQ